MVPNSPRHTDPDNIAGCFYKMSLKYIILTYLKYLLYYCCIFTYKVYCKPYVCVDPLQSQCSSVIYFILSARICYFTFWLSDTQNRIFPGGYYWCKGAKCGPHKVVIFGILNTEINMLIKDTPPTNLVLVIPIVFFFLQLETCSRRCTSCQHNV